MTNLSKEAGAAARMLIAEANEPEVVREMALWLIFESEIREGEPESETQLRLEMQAKRKWPHSTTSDYYRAEGLSEQALELAYALLERGVHKIH